jgi:hypothetical protein
MEVCRFMQDSRRNNNFNFRAVRDIQIRGQGQISTINFGGNAHHIEDSAIMARTAMLFSALQGAQICF